MIKLEESKLDDIVVEEGEEDEEEGQKFAPLGVGP